MCADFYEPQAAVVRRWVQRRRVFSQRSFHAFIAPLTSDPRKLKQNIEQIDQFINPIISSRLEGYSTIALDDVASYAIAIRHFIEYILLTERQEDQARLIVTSIEELLNSWFRRNNITRSESFARKLESFFESEKHIVSKEFREKGKQKIANSDLHETP